MDDKRDSDICAIFLCEFHSTVGTKIIEQSPKNFITKEVFGEDPKVILEFSIC